MKPLSKTNTPFDPNDSITVSVWKRREQVKKKKNRAGIISGTFPALKDTVTNRMRDSYRSSRRWQFFLLIQSWSPVFVSDQSAHEELCSKFVTQAEIKTIYRSLQRRGTSSSPSRFMMESLSHGKDETQIPFARHFLRLWDIWATAKLASWRSAWN